MISTLCGPHGEVRRVFPGSLIGYFTGGTALIVDAGISNPINRKEDSNKRAKYL